MPDDIPHPTDPNFYSRLFLLHPDFTQLSTVSVPPIASKPLLPYEPSGPAERKIDWTGVEDELRQRFNSLPDRVKAACEQRGQKPDTLRHLFGIADGNQRTLLEKIGLARGMLFDFERDMQTNGALEDLNECFLIVVVVLIREIIAPLAEKLEKHSSVRMLRWAEDPIFAGMGDVFGDVTRVEALSKAMPAVKTESVAGPNGEHHGVRTENQGVDDLVNLDEAAAIVHLSKRTLERRLKNMPVPYVQGGGGKASLWKWNKLRPWLESEYVPDLPKRFPRNVR